MRKRRLPILCVALLSTILTALLIAAPRQNGTAAAVDEIIADLTRLSGLKQSRSVQSERIGRGQVKDFLEQQIKEAVKPEEIRAEEIALKKFGLVPQEFDLKATTIDLLTEQAAAFYDFRKKKLFMINGGSDMLQHSALVHELAHALADQSFNLEKFIKKGKSDDASMARLAVMEGQATWLMSEYLTSRTGQSLTDSPVLVQMMSRATEAASGQSPIFDKAPLYIRETLLFPYTQGMLFQHAIRERLGKAGFAEVFRRAPVSTQQILHPDKYMSDMRPSEPSLPDFAGRNQYRVLTEGTIGELDFSLLLRQYAGQADAGGVAPSWRGGYYRVFEAKSGNGFVLTHASDWSGAEIASRFLALYQRVLKGKWKTYAAESVTPDYVAGRGDDGYFVLRRDGTRVTAVEGISNQNQLTKTID